MGSRYAGLPNSRGPSADRAAAGAAFAVNGQGCWSPAGVTLWEEFEGKPRSKAGILGQHLWGLLFWSCCSQGAVVQWALDTPFWNLPSHPAALQHTPAGKAKNKKMPSEVSTSAPGLSGHLSEASGNQWERVGDAVYVSTRAMTSCLSLAAT